MSTPTNNAATTSIAMNLTIPADGCTLDKNAVELYNRAIVDLAHNNARVMQSTVNSVCLAAHSGNAAFVANMAVAAAVAFKASPIECGSIRTRFNAVLKHCTGYVISYNVKNNSYTVKAPSEETLATALTFWRTVEGKEWTCDLPKAVKAPAKTNIKALLDKITGLSANEFEQLAKLLATKNIQLSK